MATAVSVVVWQNGFCFIFSFSFWEREDLLSEVRVVKRVWFYPLRHQHITKSSSEGGTPCPIHRGLLISRRSDWKSFSTKPDVCGVLGESNEFLPAFKKNMKKEWSTFNSLIHIASLFLKQCSLGIFPSNLGWQVGFGMEWGGATSPTTWQSKINQSNQKNITEYIRAGRCRSLPSCSIDLQSCLQCTTVLQMKQPNLIFPHNAAIRCRYDSGWMEYLPRNGNAFDSSVSELLNLRAVDAYGAFSAPKKSAFCFVFFFFYAHRSVFVAVFPPCSPVCILLQLWNFAEAPQQPDSVMSAVKL